jgi:methylglyoxal/glyoxal reductase
MYGRGYNNYESGGMNMPKHITDYTILNNNVKMPWLGLGVWRTKDGEEVEQAVKNAIKLGYRSIDTAAIYNNENGVGNAIKASEVLRKDLFITTKVWNSDQGYESTLKAFEVSRKKLGLEYLDRKSVV